MNDNKNLLKKRNLVTLSSKIWFRAIKITIVYLIFLAMAIPFFMALAVMVPQSKSRASKKQIKGNKPNILWGPIPLINISFLSRIERQYGYKSNTLVYDIAHINKEKDFDYVIKLFNNPALDRMLVLASSYFVFLWALWNYDIFQFYFNGGYLVDTPLKRIELPLLKLAGKKIIVSPYGGDVMLPSKIKNKYKWNVALFIEEDYPYINEKEIVKNVQYHMKYADYIITGGDLVDYTPRYDMWIHLVGVDLNEWTPTYETNNSKIKIVHAPNHRALKGTQYLIDVCNELIKEGYPVELVLVEKMKNDDAKKVYEQADIIADQFLIGYHGLFAVEAMALGKPVLCYLRENILSKNPHASEVPIVSANPDNLKEKLITLINDRNLRIEIGKKGRVYVEKYYSKEYIGSQLDKVYRELWLKKER